MRKLDTSTLGPIKVDVDALATRARVVREAGRVEAKTASAGARMLRRSDVIGLLRKLIAQGHERANGYGERGEVASFLAERREIAAHYDAVAKVQDLPTFINAQTVPAEPKEPRP